MIKSDLIGLAPLEEKLEFILQELACNPDIAGTDNIDTAATFFSHVHNIKFPKTFWKAVIWPKYLENKNAPAVEPIPV